MGMNPPTLCDRCACWTREPVRYFFHGDDFMYYRLCPRCHGVVTKALAALKPKRRKNARGA